MTEDMILLNKSGGVARVTLNRPDLRNAFNDVLISELHAMLVDIEQDPSVRAVVLAGNGPAFCAGADLGWMKRMADFEHAQNLSDAQALADMLATLDRIQKPTIARVHGAAFAGGTGPAIWQSAALMPNSVFQKSGSAYLLPPSAHTYCGPLASAPRGATFSPLKFSIPLKRTGLACFRPWCRLTHWMPR